MFASHFHVAFSSRTMIAEWAGSSSREYASRPLAIAGGVGCPKLMQRLGLRERCMRRK